MAKKVMKVEQKKSGGLVQRINEVLKDHNGQLAMVIKHETASPQKSGGVRRNCEEPTMDLDIEPRIKTTLRVGRVCKGLPVEKLREDGIFSMPAFGGIVVCKRASEKDQFSVEFLKGEGYFFIPAQSVIPLKKKAPEDVSGEEILDILKSREHGMGLIGDKAVIEWLLGDYLDNPESNAPEVLAQAIKHLKIDKEIGLPNFFVGRHEAAEARFQQVEEAIYQLVPQKLRELRSSIEHEKKQLETLIELSTERRGG